MTERSRSMDEHVIPVICKNSCCRRDRFSFDDKESCFVSDGSASEFNYDQYVDLVSLSYDARIIIFVIVRLYHRKLYRCILLRSTGALNYDRGANYWRYKIYPLGGTSVTSLIPSSKGKWVLRVR
jgi:hypothetical protein